MLINVVLPVVILTKFSGENFLWSTWGLIVALAFPLVYGIWDWYKEKKVNFFSAIGLLSVFMTGVIGVMEIPTKWVAIKEAWVPLLFWLVLLFSIWKKHPLMKKMLAAMLDFEKIDEAISRQAIIEQEASIRTLDNLYVKITYWMVFSFLISAVLNYILAKVIVVSPAWTEAFNQEIGKMTGLSYPVIVIPLTIMLTVVMMIALRKVQKVTGLEFEEMMNG